MKPARRVIAVLTALILSFALAGAASAAPRPGVHPRADPAALLTSASITFFTDTDDKDGDTFVATRVLDGTLGRLAARAQGFYARFPDQTDNGPFPLTVRSGETADALEFGRIEITITPNGHDTWNFSYILTLHFSDGSTEEADSGPVSLSQNRRVSNVDLVF